MITPLTEKLASDDEWVALYIYKILYIPSQT